MTAKASSRITIDIVLIAVTAALTGILSWGVTRCQLGVAHSDKIYDSKLSCFERSFKVFSEFSSTGFAYLQDYATPPHGTSPADADAKHIAYHRAESELQTCLVLIPIFFHGPARDKTLEVKAYFDRASWEGIVQSTAFASKAQALDVAAGESLTDLIGREVYYDQYLTLTRELTALMAQEISADSAR
jgi:hypothetical protein